MVEPNNACVLHPWHAALLTLASLRVSVTKMLKSTEIWKSEAKSNIMLANCLYTIVEISKKKVWKRLLFKKPIDHSYKWCIHIEHRVTSN